MTADTFMQNFDLLAEAPGGVPKLRELILQLAVRGKLVPQEEGEVHHEGHEEHERKKEGERIEGPYAVPPGWRWTTLRGVSSELGQKVPDAPFTYVDVSAIDKDKGCIGDGTQVLRPEDAPSRARKIVKRGTVIYSTVRPYLLNIAVVDRKFEPAPIVSTAFFVMHPHPEVDGRFLFYYLRSQPFTEYVNGAMTGMAYPAVNDAKMTTGPFPLPPLAEQKRIVARVDELMKRCDELEARQKERDERHKVTVSACLHALSSPPTTDHRQPITDHWSLITAHFPLLFTSPASVAELRKTILQLAVQGRLVPQDPRDEPAAVLLERLETARPTTVDGRKLKQPVQLPPVEEAKVPYEMPPGWRWARFGHVACIASNLVQPNQFGDLPHVAPNNIEKDSGRLLECVTVADDNVSSGNHRFFRGQILYSKIRPNLNKVTVAPFEGLCSADMYPIDSLICTAYLAQYMLSGAFLSMSVKGDTRVAMPKINQEQLNVILVAVPPLAEQKRIVAKVSELTALCDALEAKLTQSRADAEILAAAVVHHLTGVGNAV